jgi:hypothetical protein
VRNNLLRFRILFQQGSIHSDWNCQPAGPSQHLTVRPEGFSGNNPGNPLLAIRSFAEDLKITLTAPGRLSAGVRLVDIRIYPSAFTTRSASVKNVSIIRLYSRGLFVQKAPLPTGRAPIYGGVASTISTDPSFRGMWLAFAFRIR